MTTIGWIAFSVMALVTFFALMIAATALDALDQVRGTQERRK